MACNVKVICRFRPVNEQERAAVLGDGEAGSGPYLKFLDEKTLAVNWKGKQESFSFDRAFGSTETESFEESVSEQETVWREVQDAVAALAEGFNATIFAYGQTGAGKTHTMFGPSVPLGPGMSSGQSSGSASSLSAFTAPLRGIIPRACAFLFELIGRDTTGSEFQVKCSFLEIYKETIHDLLNPKEGTNLKVRETPARGVWVEGLTEQFVASQDEILELLALGEKFRSRAFTKMNAASSRSHSLFIISLIQKMPDGSTKEGRLNLADLAGSEKVNKTGATGNTLDEAKKINQSLSALGNCIHALSSAKKSTHIPYRDSKLTFVLRESLGGNAKTTLIIACSPHPVNADETVSTLRFGSRAKTIQNNAKAQVHRSAAELQRMLEQLQLEMQFLRKYIAHLESVIEKHHPGPFDFQAAKQSLLSTPLSRSSSSPSVSFTPPSSSSSSSSSSSIPLSDGRFKSESTSSVEFGAEQEDGDYDDYFFPSSSSSSSPRLSAGQNPLDQKDSDYQPLKIAEMQMELEKQKEAAQFQQEQLKEQIDQWMEKYKTKEQEALKVRSVLDSEQTLMQQLRSENDTLRVQINNEQDSLFESKKQIQSLKQEIRQKQNAIDDLQLELQRAVALAEETTTPTSPDELAELNKKLNDVETERDSLSFKVNELQQQLQMQQSKTESLQQSNSSLQSTLAQVEGDLQALQNAQVESIKQLEASNANTETLTRTISLIRQETSDLRKCLVSHGLDDQQIPSASLESHGLSLAPSPDLQAEVDRLKGKLLETQSDLRLVNLANTSLEKKLALLAQQLAQSQADLQASQEFADKIQQNHEAQRAQFSLHNKRLSAKLLSPRTSLTLSPQDDLFAMADEAARLKRQVQELEEQREAEANLASEREIQLQNRIALLASDMNKSRDEHEQYIKLLETEKIEQEKAIQQLKEEIEWTKESHPKLNSNQVKVITPVVNHRSMSMLLTKPFQKREGLPQRQTIVGPIKEGYLVKQGEVFRTWRKRWCVLKGQPTPALYYFADNKAQDPKGDVQLVGCVAQRADKDVNKQFVFGIYDTKGSRRTFYFQTTSEVLCAEWIKTINDLINPDIDELIHRQISF